MDKHIKNKNQSPRSSFEALKNCIMLNVSLAKTELNTLVSSMICSSKLCKNKQNKWGQKLLLSLRLILAPPSHISSGCWAILIVSTFLECLSTWDCSWLLLVYLFLRNLKMVCKSPYTNVKYHVDLKFPQGRNWALLWETFVHSLWSCVRVWSKQEIIYGFGLYVRENFLWYTHTQLYFTIFYRKVEWSQLFCWKCTTTVNSKNTSLIRTLNSLLCMHNIFKKIL